MIKKGDKNNLKVSFVFDTLAQKSAALKRAKQLSGNAGFGRYMRHLIHLDLETLDEGKK